MAALPLSCYWQAIFWARRGGQQILVLVEGSEYMSASHGTLAHAIDGWKRTALRFGWTGTFIFLFLGISCDWVIFLPNSLSVLCLHPLALH